MLAFIYILTGLGESNYRHVLFNKIYALCIVANVT